MKILLTNDDGYDAVGLKALIKALTPIAKVMVVAPAKNKSACGHSLTLDKPLRLISIDDEYYKIDDATPTDCIYLSLGHLFKNGYRPDLVISGINIGANMVEQQALLWSLLFKEFQQLQYLKCAKIDVKIFKMVGILS